MAAEGGLRGECIKQQPGMITIVTPNNVWEAVSRRLIPTPCCDEQPLSQLSAQAAYPVSVAYVKSNFANLSMETTTGIFSFLSPPGSGGGAGGGGGGGAAGGRGFSSRSGFVDEEEEEGEEGEGASAASSGESRRVTQTPYQLFSRVLTQLNVRQPMKSHLLILFQMYLNNPKGFFDFLHALVSSGPSSAAAAAASSSSASPALLSAAAAEGAGALGVHTGENIMGRRPRPPLGGASALRVSQQQQGSSVTQGGNGYRKSRKRSKAKRRSTHKG
jgi:hypothetical protein